jgi:hypothetical protein
LPPTPDFRKCLPMDKAMADEVIIATSMNGSELPHFNGYPARIVVPGWTATYWMKHIVDIQISSKPFDGFWMQKAYRVPAGMFPVEHPFPSQDAKESWPITEMVVNSLVATPLDGGRASAHGFTVEGVAWDWTGARVGGRRRWGRIWGGSVSAHSAWPRASWRRVLIRFRPEQRTMPVRFRLKS